MKVVKRNGNIEEIQLDKITKRIAAHSKDLKIDPVIVAQKVVLGLHDMISTKEIDNYAIQTASLMVGEDPEYSLLASRLLSSVIDKEVKGQEINSFLDSITQNHANGILSDEVFNFVKKNSVKLVNAIKPKRDDLFEYFGMKTVYDRYLLKHPTTRMATEAPQYFFMRVACGLSKNVSEAIELYNLLSSLDYMTSTPTLFNSGTKRPQMSSCYLLASPEDDLGCIYDRYKDVAMLSKWAGGIGLSYSKIRGQGALIKGTNGFSNGIIPWLKTLDASVSATNQGGRRKGAACVYLDTWHVDIESFLELRDNTGDHDRRTHNLNLANWIPDLFMKRVKAQGMWSLFDPSVAPQLTDLYGAEFEVEYVRLEEAGLYKKQVRAADLYYRMMKTLAETGNGWMNYKDHSNVKSNQTKLSKNVIHSSNLCLHGDTLIATSTGHRKISDLVGETAQVFDGLKWVEVNNFQKTKENADLVEVSFADGSKIKCTPYHKFPVGDKFVRAMELVPGDAVNISEAKVDADKPAIKGAYAKGFLLGDGTLLRNSRSQHGEKAGLYLYEPKYMCENRFLESISEIEPKLKIFRESDSKDAYFAEGPTSGRKSLFGITNRNYDLVKWAGEYKEKLTSEVLNWGKHSQIEFLAGLFDANGTVLNSGESRCYQLASVSKDTIEMVHLLLKQLGINSKLSLMREAMSKKFADGQPEYNCRPLYRLTVSNSASRAMSQMIPFERLIKFDSNAGLKRTGKPYKTKPNFNVVESVTALDEKADVFCCGVETTNQFALSCGIMSGNCTEILEVTSNNETAVCNLGSVNLSNHVADGGFDFNRLAKTVKTAVKYLDRVVDINFYPIKSAEESNKKWRPVGLGIMGLQDVYFKMGLAFDSPEAREISKRISEEIYFHSLKASMELAKENGAHPNFKETRAADGVLQFDMWGVTPSQDLDWSTLREDIKTHGLRNSLLIAIAPTATIASIVGSYECIEPQVSNLFKRETLSGEFIQINKYLTLELQKLGLWTKEVREQIKEANGSIQQIAEIPANIKEIYRTIWELPMRALIDMAAERGAFIDQSQSLNLFMESPTIGKLSSMYMYAWEKGVKTTYYLRSRPATAIAKTTAKAPVKEAEPKKEVTPEQAIMCSLENPEACESCQ